MSLSQIAKQLSIGKTPDRRRLTPLMAMQIAVT
jgi:hypothetical protein